MHLGELLGLALEVPCSTIGRGGEILKIQRAGGVAGTLICAQNLLPLSVNLINLVSHACFSQALFSEIFSHSSIEYEIGRDGSHEYHRKDA